MTPEALIERIAREGYRLVEFRFTDLSGRMRHTAVDAASVDATILTHGLFIDGSSVPGWREITEADLLLRPDLATAFADPFAAQPTLVLLCDGAEPATGMGYERDPRSVARRAVQYLADLGLAEAVLVGVELSAFLFDDVRVELGPMRAGFALQGSESRPAAAQSFAGGNPGHRPLSENAYLALPPADHLRDLRAEVTSILKGLGFGRVQHRHGRGLGQCEFTLPPRPLLEAADGVQLLKYVLQQVAASYGKSATFMPKPLADEPGSGLFINISLHKDQKPLFAGQAYADLSPLCLAFIAGVLAHARALNAFTNPTTNSYRRLRAGAEEPVLLAYAAFNRSAAIRIPFAATPQSKRIEIRFGDPASNPYLAFAALLMAGLDGIERRLEPGDAMDRNLYDLRAEEVDELPRACARLD